MNNNILLIIFLCVASACNTTLKHVDPSEEGMKIIKVRDMEDTKSVYLSSIFRQARIVPLDYSEDNMIGEVEQLRIWSDKLYIMDKYNEGSISIFDLDGNFIRKVGKAGRGPNEFTVISDFDVDKNNGDVYIYDNHTRNIFVYSHLGEFQRKILITEYKDFFRLHGNKFYLYRKNPSLGSPYELEIFDLEGKKESSYFKGNSELMASGVQVFGIGTNDKILFNAQFNDTVYSIADGNLQKSFLIDFGNHAISAAHKVQLEVEPGETASLCLKYNYAHGAKNFIENDSFLFFNYVYQNMRYSAMYNKTEDTCFSTNSIIDDLSYLYYGDPLTIYQDNLVCVYDDIALVKNNIDRLTQHLASGVDNAESANQTLSLLTQIYNEDFKSNPLIVLYSFGDDR